ncbi:17 kDa surface antigen [Paraburkholderia atlantica]|uniref:17 kDa surface antigen n=1 Tax=Paraburkholderia atlantica TaxID=2654982 RepID=D5W952_PARAM|nr:glycine zipper 2TM domain-containing protein [Paraburkholderia atlantica]ADG15947.1 17 kDa surface antigen [Paraburkholderia atlantica]
MDTPTHQSTQPRRLHPLIAVAAGAVLVASLVATAAITGVFPKASGNGAQNDQTQAAQVSTQVPGVVDSAAPVNPSAQQQQVQAQPAAQPAPAPAPVQQQQYAQQQQAQAAPQSQYAQQPEPQAAPQYAQQPAPRAAHCSNCGTVVAISAVRHEGHGTGIGAVGGAVAGGVVGNQFGAGSGRTAMTLLGALGGGLAGNSVEKHLRSTTSYSVRVRMEDGKTRYFTYHEAPPFHDGERVRVQNGGLVAD